MRKLVIVVSLLLVSGAYADNIVEDPLDDGVGGWGADTFSPFVEGPRTYSKISSFNDAVTGAGQPQPWWYFACNRWMGGVVDISAGLRFEVDVRMHQQAGGGYSWLSVRLGTWDAGVYGEYFHSPEGEWPNWDPTNPSGINLINSNDGPFDTWVTVGFDLSLAAAAGMDLTQFDGFEFFGGFDGANPNLDYFDVDNMVITPEPASLLLLGLGLVAATRRR